MLLFKIMTSDEYTEYSSETLKCGVWSGSALDTKDGFIHLSTQHQWASTAQMFYSHFESLVLMHLEIDLEKGNIRWEGPDGQSYPHLYRQISTLDFFKAQNLTRKSDGSFQVES